jgi:hypothetical protein
MHKEDFLWHKVSPPYNARVLTWSSLPSICFEEGFSAENEDTSIFRMAMEQLIGWPDFEAMVRASTNACLGSQTQIVPIQIEKELICVGNEHGLMSRFGRNIAHAMTEVNNKCGLPIRYGDYQVGRTIGGGYGRGGVPDLILIDNQHGIRAVWEGKTFWTKDLKSSTRQTRALWFGKPFPILSGMKQLAHVSRSVGQIHG